MTKEDLRQDPLQIFAEPYNTLILDKKGFLNPVPDIPWLAPKENMKAWVDRKSFIHNLGHAVAAYTGFLKHPGKTYLYEILDDPEIFSVTRDTMLQSAAILMRIYPGEFTMQDLTDHIDDLLSRFRSIALKDTVFRVGCGPDPETWSGRQAGSTHQGGYTHQICLTTKSCMHLSADSISGQKMKPVATIPPI